MSGLFEKDLAMMKGNVYKNIFNNSQVHLFNELQNGEEKRKVKQ